MDLRPRTGPGFALPVRIEPQDLQRGVQRVIVTTAAGDEFTAFSGDSQNDHQVVLPVGTYTLYARMDNRDTVMQGSTKVTVTGPRTETATIQLEPAVTLPLEYAVDPASTAATTPGGGSVVQAPAQAPDPRQFNLYLHSMATAQTIPNRDIGLGQRGDKGYYFQVPPGRYRLQSNSAGQWYVESASYGVANLMSSEIVVSSSGTGLPIRIVANNTFGTVNGTVKLSGSADTIWVYLIPQASTIAPVNPVGVNNTGTTGAFSMRLPVGSYAALALDHRVQEDLRDPAVLSKLAAAGQSFEVNTSTAATLELGISTEETQ